MINSFLEWVATGMSVKNSTELKYYGKYWDLVFDTTFGTIPYSVCYDL